MFLDVNHRAIGAGDDGLAGSAGEPVNDRAAHDQAQDDFRLHNAQLGDGTAKQVFQKNDDAEHHGGGANDCGADEDGFGRGLESVARAVAFFELVLGVFKVRVEAEVALDFRFDVLAPFDLDEPERSR